MHTCYMHVLKAWMYIVVYMYCDCLLPIDCTCRYHMTLCSGDSALCISPVTRGYPGRSFIYHTTPAFLSLVSLCERDGSHCSNEPRTRCIPHCFPRPAPHLHSRELTHCWEEQQCSLTSHVIEPDSARINRNSGHVLKRISIEFNPSSFQGNLPIHPSFKIGDGSAQ